MQAVVTNRPNSFRALLVVVVVGAALIVAMLGGYAAGSRTGHESPGSSTSITQSSSGSGAGLHGRFGGFQ